MLFVLKSKTVFVLKSKIIYCTFAKPLLLQIIHFENKAVGGDVILLYNVIHQHAYLKILHRLFQHLLPSLAFFFELELHILPSFLWPINHYFIIFRICNVVQTMRECMEKEIYK